MRIRKANFPSTKEISDISSVMSILVLKLLGNIRLSHDKIWNLDRALGLSAKLNVLPKSSTLSSYSYRVSRESNQKFLLELNKIFSEEGEEFNLDFKTIPHWGDESVLEKNWSSSHRKAIKSILALIVQNPLSGMLTYTNAEIKHDNQSDAVLEFVDFWKEGKSKPPNMLIFDSKFTTYENLSKLNQDKIKFLTIRRRGGKLNESVLKIKEKAWEEVTLDGKSRKHKKIKVYEESTKLRNYKGNVRQIIITEHGRKNPTFLITNDFKSPIKVLINKYARRWLVEKEIAEQIAFFQLNHPSSSIVIKVDFDLTLSLLAHNLYKRLTAKLPGFENCTVPTICRNFIENGARIVIANRQINVFLKKKTHLPVLFELPWLKKETYLPWLDCTIKFHQDSVS